MKNVIAAAAPALVKPARTFSAATVMALLIAASAGAQSVPQEGRPPPPPIRLHQLAPNIFWATEGSNVGVLVGRDGVVVYDTGGSAARARELLAEIATITDKPVRMVVLSHEDADHVGGLSGFPAGVEIVAQDATRADLSALAASSASAGTAIVVPTHAVSGHETISLPGLRFQLLHWAAAHTAGDLVLYLPDQKIAFAGDLFCMDQPRAFIKPELNGSSAGWIRSANALLALPVDRIVVGHGGVETSATLRRYVRQTAAERDAIAARVAKGEPLARIEREVGEPQPSEAPNPRHEHRAYFARVVYGELTGKPPG